MEVSNILQMRDIIYAWTWHLDLNTEKKKILTRPCIIMLHFFNWRYFQRTKLNCDDLPLNSIWDVRKKKKSVKTTKRHICLLNTLHIRLPNTKTWALSNRRRSPIPQATWLFPYQISMTFPGSPQPSQGAPLRHSKCHESQEDIWYLWYHTLGSCQRTTTCQKDFAEERQNHKRLAEGPLSNWISIPLSSNTLTSHSFQEL